MKLAVFLLYFIMNKTMTQLDEHSWLAISFYLTPMSLKKILQTADLYTAESFSRCQTVIMQNIFHTLGKTVGRLRKNHSPQYIFERYLQEHGFIPHINAKTVNNSQYGYIANGEWKEWKAPTVNIMRYYWKMLLRNIAGGRTNSLFQDVLQETVKLLPGEFKMCSRCLWNLPISEFENEDLCTFCHDTQNNYTLLRHGNIPCLLPPRSLIKCS